MAKAARKKDTGAPQTAWDTTVESLDRERVAQRAYELYLARGGAAGQALDDWLVAERELMAGNVNAGDPRRRSDEP